MILLECLKCISRGKYYSNTIGTKRTQLLFLAICAVTILLKGPSEARNRLIHDF